MVEGEEVIGICCVCVECCGQGVSFGRKSNLLKGLQAKARIASEHQCQAMVILGGRGKQEEDSVVPFPRVRAAGMFYPSYGFSDPPTRGLPVPIPVKTRTLSAGTGTGCPEIPQGYL
jgi:hypothetical protein